jgi:hypothetical protein
MPIEQFVHPERGGKTDLPLNLSNSPTGSVPRSSRDNLYSIHEPLSGMAHCVLCFMYKVRGFGRLGDSFGLDENGGVAALRSWICVVLRRFLFRLVAGGRVGKLMFSGLIAWAVDGH